MSDVHHVTCPCCSTVLVVERKSGKVLEERRPILEQSSGDRFTDAERKVRERTSVAEEKFARFKSDQTQKMARLDALFKDKVREVEESGGPTKENPFEND